MPITVRDLPAKNLAFRVLKKPADLENTFVFADSLVRKLARFQKFEEIVAEPEFLVTLHP